MKRAPIPRKRAKPRRVSVVRSPEYRKFLGAWGWCVICWPNWQQPLQHNLCSSGDQFNMFIDAAHTTNNGMSSKGGDDTCAPLCRVHHAEYDADRKAFERKYGVDMKAIAKAWWELFQRRTS